MKPSVNKNIPFVQTFMPELNFCLVHSTERPFTCVECGESFKWKKNLGKFFVLYTGDKQRLFTILWTRDKRERQEISGPIQRWFRVGRIKGVGGWGVGGGE